MVSAEIKELLQRNAAATPEPVRARNSQAMRLNLGSRTITLVNASGRATPAGKYFYQKVRKQAIPDAKWDDDAVTYRKPGGRTDFVKLRNGAEIRLRTWNAAKGDFDYSEAGKQFYKRRPRNYIVQIPATVYNKRRNGTEESYAAHWPATDLGPEIRELLNGVTGTNAGAQRVIKSQVLQLIRANGNGTYRGQPILGFGSGQTIVYNPGGGWHFAMMQTTFEEGQPRTEAVMNRSLNGWRFPCKNQDTVLPEAYEDDGRNCVIRQLSKLLDIS